jgi:hypothetical protein
MTEITAISQTVPLAAMATAPGRPGSAVDLAFFLFDMCDMVELRGFTWTLDAFALTWGVRGTFEAGDAMLWRLPPQPLED